MGNPIALVIAIGATFYWMLSGFKDDFGGPGSTTSKRGKYFITGLAVMIGIAVIFYLVLKYVFHLSWADMQKPIGSH